MQAVSELASDQQREWGDVSHRHRKAIEDQRRKLTILHKLDERQGQIDQLYQKLESPDRLEKFAHRFLRWDKKIAWKIGELEATQENAQQRIDEVVGKLEVERDTKLGILEQEHQQDREELPARLERWRPTQCIERQPDRACVTTPTGQRWPIIEPLIEWGRNYQRL